MAKVSFILQVYSQSTQYTVLRLKTTSSGVYGEVFVFVRLTLNFRAKKYVAVDVSDDNPLFAVVKSDRMCPERRRVDRSLIQSPLYTGAMYVTDGF